MRILFITASRIGDAVLSTGLMAWLAERHPHARFTVACGPATASLFQAAPCVERVIPMVKRRRAGHWLDLWRATAGTYWSMVVDLRGSAIAWALPTFRRRVLRSSWEPKHRLFHLSSALGLDTALAPRLWHTPEQAAEAAVLIPAGSPVLALGPTANWRPKQWPAERFLDLARRLTAPDGILPDGRVAVFGAADERPSIQALLDGLDLARRIDLVGKVSLPVVHACIGRCVLYVGNDSGLMHIAATTGRPTIGLFGPSSETFYGPWGEHCAALRGPRSFEDICHAPDFDHRSQECMMLDLGVEAVADSTELLWRRASQAL